MFAQAGGEGKIHVLFEEIIYYINDGSEFKQEDAFITTRNGNNR